MITFRGLTRSPRAIASACALLLVSAVATGCASAGTPHVAASSASQRSSQADAILRIVRDYMSEAHLKSVIVRVSVDGKTIVRDAEGESMTGVPATVDMHFRNGAVAISYMATLLLELVDQKKISLDDKLAKYVPDLPHADEITIGELARMTSGYQDYVIGNDAFGDLAYGDVYKAWTTQEQLDLAIDKPLFYTPGTNWDYAHTNYVVLGLVLEKVTGMPLEQAIKKKVLNPLGLHDTVASQTAAIPEPVLHAFTSERRPYFGIPADKSFYEESTFWNPSWTLARGSIETTDIDDLHATAIAVGTGKLLSKESYALMTSTDLRGKTTPIDGCPTCAALNDYATYGIGLWITGDWYFQNPLFSGYAAADAYLPSKKIAIAVAVTYDEAAFDAKGDYPNGGDALFRKIGAYLAPDDAPPVKNG